MLSCCLRIYLCVPPLLAQIQKMPQFFAWQGVLHQTADILFRSECVMKEAVKVYCFLDVACKKKILGMCNNAAAAAHQLSPCCVSVGHVE